jgi:hypothetical protein
VRREAREAHILFSVKMLHVSECLAAKFALRCVFKNVELLFIKQSAGNMDVQ